MNLKFKVYGQGMFAGYTNSYVVSHGEIISFTIVHELHNFNFDADGFVFCANSPCKDIDNSIIFEGDTVKCVHDGYPFPIPKRVGEVKMTEGRWVVDFGNRYIDLFQEIAEWKIVGNIYENKEKI